MEFYKKNPEIKGSITVQGKLIDDDTVVSGEQFKVFADPKTFPGTTVRLVRVEFKDLSQRQKDQVQDFIAEQKGLPPRHLGVIKSDAFKATDGGNVKVVDTAAVTPTSTRAVRSEPVPPKEPERPREPLVDPSKEKPKLVSEMFTHQTFAETFPGITEKNAKKALKQTTTLEALANADNATLRKMGISPSFYGRLREKAQELLGEQEA